MGRPKNVISNSFVAYLTTIFNLVYLIGKSTFLPCQIYDLVGSPKSMGWVGFVVTLSLGEHRLSCKRPHPICQQTAIEWKIYKANARSAHLPLIITDSVHFLFHIMSRYTSFVFCSL